MLALIGLVAGWLGLSKLRLVLIGAAVTAALAAAGGLYLKGRLDAAHAAELAALRAERAAVARGLAAREAQGRILARSAETMRQRIEELERYVDTMDDPDRECLSAGDVERLRALRPPAAR